MDQPRAVDVVRLKAPAVQGNVRHSLGDRGSHDVHGRTGIHQAAHTSYGHRSPTDDEDPPTGDVQVQRVAHLISLAQVAAATMPAPMVVPVASSMTMKAPVVRSDV